MTPWRFDCIDCGVGIAGRLIVVAGVQFQFRNVTFH